MAREVAGTCGAVEAEACHCLQTAQATQSIANSMQKTTAVMESMGKQMTPQQMQKTMQQFAMENQKMDMSSEMIDDAISDALDSDDVEGETDDVVNQVCGNAIHLVRGCKGAFACIAWSMPCASGLTVTMP